MKYSINELFILAFGFSKLFYLIRDDHQSRPDFPKPVDHIRFALLSIIICFVDRRKMNISTFLLILDGIRRDVHADVSNIYIV